MPRPLPAPPPRLLFRGLREGPSLLAGVRRGVRPRQARCVAFAPVLCATVLAAGCLHRGYRRQLWANAGEGPVPPAFPLLPPPAPRPLCPLASLCVF